MIFTQAIVRRPGRSIVSGLSSAPLKAPVYEKTLEQHRHYVEALKRCGLEVLLLDAAEEYPDSTFVEDEAVLTPHCAIITAPAALSRKGEIAAIKPVLEGFYPRLERIVAPGTLEGGDVLQVGNHYYIGLSGRTNSAGAQQLISILEKYGMTGSTIPVHEFLHLKTGVTWVGDKDLVAAGEFIAHPQFQGFAINPVVAQEAGAANCILINDKILLAAGFPQTRRMLAKLGPEVIEIDISEFAKIDGGLTCLSLRF